MAHVIYTKPKPLIGRKGIIQLGIAGLIGTVIAIPYLGAALRYLFPAQGGGGDPLQVPLGTLKFQNGVAGPLTYEFHKGQGDVAGIFVVKDGNTYTGFEQTCTHLGCPVAWNATDNQFQCPCHGSHFNRQGNVVAGPAPIPLYKHEVTAQGDTLTIKGRV